MNFHSIFVILPLTLFVGSYALEYRLLEKLKMTCPTGDNCLLASQASFDTRSCECDDLCNDFRDCCIDKANLTTGKTKKFPCMTFGDQDKVGVYVVDTCPQNNSESTTIKDLCQNGDDFTDPLISTPVTVASTGTTFKNRYCAECNGASASSLVSWLLYLNCDPLILIQMNDSFIWQNIKYNTSLKTWGVKLDDEFHTCELKFDKPNSLKDIRFCRANTIDSCPSTFRREKVKRLCESYSAVVHDAQNSYKNPHCAICNNKNMDDLRCVNLDLVMRSGKMRFPFNLMLDMNRQNGAETITERRCPSGERYDPFFKKCRALVCVLPGYKYVNGKCTKV